MSDVLCGICGREVEDQDLPGLLMGTVQGADACQYITATAP